MKRFFFLVTITWTCLSQLAAQQADADSLRLRLSTEKDEKVRVTLLESLSYSYLSSYPDSSMKFANEGLELARKIHYPHGEAICINAIGNVYFHIGNYAKALELYAQYLQLKEKLNEFDNISVAYYNMGTVYTEQGDYHHALQYFSKTRALDEKQKDSTAILFDLYSLGSVYRRLSNYDSAIYYSDLALKMARQINDRNLLGAIFHVMGESRLMMHDDAAAFGFYQASIPYAEEVQDYEVLAADYTDLATIYQHRKQEDSSLYFARKALALAEQGPFYKQVLLASDLLVDLFKNAKKFDSAFFYQQLSMQTKDSVFNIAEVKKIDSIKLQEQHRQQQLETAGIRYREKIKLLAVISASLVFLGVALLFWRNSKQKHRANIQLREQKEKIESTLAELKSAQALLIQSEKMASLGQLTAGIAHEIQNPLNFVNNFSEVNLELIGELKEEWSKYAAGRETGIITELLQDLLENERKINQHGKRADYIVKGMLEHSRTGSGKKQPTDINDLAEEYLKIAYHAMKGKNEQFDVAMITNFDATIGNIPVVPQDIGKALLNIYNNAFWAASPGSTSNEDMRAEHGSNTKKPTVSVSTKNLGARIEIRVIDNGPGIPENIRDKIFQPFFTTKPTGSGTGLGLSLTYDIIKAHGGEIRVHSQPGEGTEFIILLPA